jgi:hypothetical protein
MQFVHADLIVDLPKTHAGNTLICVCVDAFTGWLTLSAHCHKDAETIWRSLTNETFFKFGVPEVIKTDNGTEFRNGTAKAIQHLLHIHAMTTVPYNPQGNGKVENRNKTIYDLLTAMCKDDPENHRRWDELLPVVAWSYNTTVNEATGFTPFRALYGREARTPTDDWISDFAAAFNADILDYVSRITNVLRHVWDAIALRTIEEQDRIAELHNTKFKRAFTPYRVGEQFYYRTIPRRTFKSLNDEKKYKLSSKLQYRYTGPHTITAVINPVTYKSSMDGFDRTVHANRMKRDSRRDISRAHIRQARLTKRKARRPKQKGRSGPDSDEDPEEGKVTDDKDTPLPAASPRETDDDDASRSLTLAMSVYGLYTEEIVVNYRGPDAPTAREGALRLLPHKPQAPRTVRSGSDEPLLATTMYMRDHQGVQPHQAIVRDDRDSWCMENGSSEARAWVSLTGKGCLWRASKPDDMPFNGKFHSPTESCRKCEPGK